MLRVFLSAALAILISCTPSKEEEAQEKAALASSAFRAFVDDYFKALFEFRPSLATSHGFHEYDHRLEDLSEESYRRRIETLKSLASRLHAIQAQKLGSDDAIDAALLEGQIQSELLDVEEMQTWRTNPMEYVGLPGSGVDLLIKRDFAPAKERLRSVIARLEGVPKVLTAMQANVVNPPKEFTDLARRMARGSVGFFRDDISKWALTASGSDPELFRQFEKANRRAVHAFEGAVKYLDADLSKRSRGKYAIGPDRYARKLLYDEMVDTDLKQVLAIGEANLEKDYRAFIETARKIDAGKQPAQVMTMLENEHPRADQLIAFAEDTAESIRRFVVEKKIITIPSEVRPTITETPPYARSGSFASMDTPGAFERNAKEAFYYITPPEKDWSAAHKQEHLRLFNRPVMDIITVHEAYPGHYTQFLYARQFPTKTRKLVAVGTNAEGWAHYAEQMMVEEGLGNGDPRIRLAQLQEALLRDCRYIAGIKLHTEGWTVERAAKLFEQKAFQQSANAYEEARRGAYNPTYLYYTLGKLQIYKLREDYRKAKGGSLEQFHTEFIKQGAIPIKLVRQILLPGDRGPLL